MASKALPFSAFDEKTILKDLRQFIRDRKHLDRRWNALVKEHAGEWVGVYRREIIFARSLEDLLKAAGDKGWDLGGVVVSLLKERPLMAL